MGEIDLWIISDEKSSESLSIAEHDLTEDYLERGLTKDEEDRFRSSFLISVERRSQMDEIVLIKQFAAAEKAGGVKLPIEQPRSSFLSRFFPLSRPLTAAFAVLAIGLIGFIGWRIFLSPAATPLEIEYTALNNNDLATADNVYSSVQLSSGTLRDTARATKITAGALSESVLFRLALPFKPSPEFRPKLELVQNSGTVFTIQSGQIYATGAGSEARLVIPRFILVRGQNQIRLTDRGNPDSALLYVFTVE